jgi:hypothetical protein
LQLRVLIAGGNTCVAEHLAHDKMTPKPGSAVSYRFVDYGTRCETATRRLKSPKPTSNRGVVRRFAPGDPRVKDRGPWVRICWPASRFASRASAVWRLGGRPSSSRNPTRCTLKSRSHRLGTMLPSVCTELRDRPSVGRRPRLASRIPKRSGSRDPGVSGRVGRAPTSGAIPPVALKGDRAAGRLLSYHGVVSWSRMAHSFG